MIIHTRTNLGCPILATSFPSQGWETSALTQPLLATIGLPQASNEMVSTDSE